jgi:hypothetical protein
MILTGHKLHLESRNVRGRDHLEDLGADDIILK